METRFWPNSQGTARPPRKSATNRTDGAELGAEDLVSWTGHERLRFLWYRLRLTISEMNYASRRLGELRMGLPPERPTAPPAVSKKS